MIDDLYNNNKATLFYHAALNIHPSYMLNHRPEFSIFFNEIKNIVFEFILGCGTDFQI